MASITATRALLATTRRIVAARTAHRTLRPQDCRTGTRSWVYTGGRHPGTDMHEGVTRRQWINVSLVNAQCKNSKAQNYAVSL